MTQELWKQHFSSKTFILTQEQRRIMDALSQNPELSNAQIAQALGKQKNTIDMQNKQILSRARDCFPLHHFESIRDVAAVLRDMAFFEEQYYGLG